MQNKADIMLRDNQFYLIGDLDFSNVMSVFQKSLALFENHSALVLNFSELTSSNSAGLALLMEWAQYARKQDKTLEYRHFPSRLQSIAEAAGVDSFLL